MRTLPFALLLLASTAPAFGQSAQTETVTVLADPVHLLDGAPAEAATGLGLPLMLRFATGRLRIAHTTGL